MGSPYLLFAGDRLSGAELCAARLDGHVVEVGEGYMPADAVETTWMRAGSLRPLLGATLAATHASAAWVHGALTDPPRRHSVQRAVSRRLSFVFGRRIRYRDLHVPEGDRSLIAGVWVTTPERTLIDLARSPDDVSRAAALRLAAFDPALAAPALAWLRAHVNAPHRRAAMALLAPLEPPTDGQEEVTR